MGPAPSLNNCPQLGYQYIVIGVRQNLEADPHMQGMSCQEQALFWAVGADVALEQMTACPSYIYTTGTSAFLDRF